MNVWKDIYDISARMWKAWWRATEDGHPEDMPASPLWTEPSLTARLQAQEKYDADAAYEQLRKHRRRIRIGRYSGAAGILVIVTLAVGLLWQKTDDFAVTPLARQQPLIQPGTKKAVLTLANGAVMNIRDSSLSLRDMEKCLAGDSLSQVEITDKRPAEVAYHTLFVPRGGEFYLTLPDSTRVWLNSETELRFPAQFAADFRSVILKGEAYFEVAHEKNRPFLVHSEHSMITVYGTQFCVTAYEQSDLVATLVEGSIGFKPPKGKEVRLKPSQQLTYSRETQDITVREVNTGVYTSWKDQLFCFEEQSLKEIMKILARWYDVDILFESPELKQLKMSGTLDKYEEIGPLLKLFEAGQKVRFDVGEKTIVVRQQK